jgi:hypothetical protein
MTEWVAWVEITEDDADIEPAESRYYVTHGLPFLQLTPFRSAAARYGSQEVAQHIADFAAHAGWHRGAEKLPKPLTETR